jgi:hypothetical protein
MSSSSSSSKTGKKEARGFLCCFFLLSRSLSWRRHILYRQLEKKRAEIFAKIEPYLTYLDAKALEAKQVDVTSKLEASEERYRNLEERYARQEEWMAVMMRYAMAKIDEKRDELWSELMRVGRYRAAASSAAK